jgi:hypothetical protein
MNREQNKPENEKLLYPLKEEGRSEKTNFPVLGGWETIKESLSIHPSIHPSIYLSIHLDSIYTYTSMFFSLVSWNHLWREHKENGSSWQKDRRNDLGVWDPGGFSYSAYSFLAQEEAEEEEEEKEEKEREGKESRERKEDLSDDGLSRGSSEKHEKCLSLESRTCLVSAYNAHLRVCVCI